VESETSIFSSIFLNIIEEVSEGILILKEDGELLFFNEVFLRITHWRAGDILGNEQRFLESLDLHPPIKEGTFRTTFTDPEGNPHPMRLKCLQIEAQPGRYFLISVSEEERVFWAEEYKTHYDQLFRNIGDPMFTADLDGTIRTANPAFFSAFGYREDEELPPIDEMYVYRDEVDEKIQKLLSHDYLYNREAHLYAKDGSIKRVKDNTWAIHDGDGSVTGYAGHFHDVTYLRNIESRLKISERNFTLLFDTILSSVLLLAPDGRILNLNSAAEKVYGYSWEEIVGESYDDLLRGSTDSLSFAELVEKINRSGGRHYESEVPRRRRDGARIYTYAVFTEVRDISNEVIAYSLVEKDLTERVHLEHKLRESFKELKDTQSAAIIGFAKLTEYRDKDTGEHLERIREYTRIMALTLRELPKYEDYITDEYLEDLTLSSILHDVGKVGIEDNILLKPGKLDTREYERIKNHSSLGGEALNVVDQKLNKKSFLTLGKEIAMFHHERWDGTGYPNGLRGDEIPLSARIVSIADVYDALTSKRPYKEAYSHEDAVETIRSGSGSQFDPDIVDAFLKNHEVFRRIRQFTDFESHPETIGSLIRTNVLFPEDQS
jgi:PAS domain S-box-containing protein